jgi:hypothetical protein
MRIKALLVLTVLAIFAVAAYADQAAYITQAQAEKAAAFLTGKMQIRHYCAPCDDKGDRVEDIKTVVAAPVGYQDFWEVKVNGDGIDLAYVYFQTEDGKWKNLAKELDIKVSDVPKYLE